MQRENQIIVTPVGVGRYFFKCTNCETLFKRTSHQGIQCGHCANPSKLKRILR